MEIKIISWVLYGILVLVGGFMMLFVALMSLANESKGPAWEKPMLIGMMLVFGLIMLGGAVVLSRQTSWIRSVLGIAMGGAPLLFLIVVMIRSSIIENSPERQAQLKAQREEFERQVAQDAAEVRRREAMASTQPTVQPTTQSTP